MSYHSYVTASVREQNAKERNKHPDDGLEDWLIIFHPPLCPSFVLFTWWNNDDVTSMLFGTVRDKPGTAYTGGKHMVSMILPYISPLSSLSLFFFCLFSWLGLFFYTSVCITDPSSL